MNNEHALVYGNLALAVAPATRRAAAPARSLTLVEGRGVQVAPPSQIAAPDAYARRSPKPATMGHVIAAVLGIAAIAVLGIALVSGTAALRADAYADAAASVARSELRVAGGESLWSIAAEHPVAGLDTARTVELIRAWNGLSSGTLVTGQELTVPAAH